MENKTTSVRLSTEQIEYLKSLCDGNVNQAIVELIEKKQLADKYADRDIKNIFTENEWKYLADSLNGTMVMGDFRYCSSALIAGVEDSATYDNLDAKWEVNINDFKSKIQKLSSSSIEAIIRRVENFWENPEQNIDLWAKY